LIRRSSFQKTKLTRSDYLALLKGETLQKLQVNKWQRSLQDSHVLIKRNQPYHLRFSLTKRYILHNAQGVWIDTAPLQLNDY
jgi:hypothetical protein